MITNPTTITALHISPDGTIQDTAIPDTDHLGTFYALISCRYVDVIRLTTTLDMWVDDEFRYRDDDLNPMAAWLIHRYTGNFSPVRGPVIITSFNPDDGATTGLLPDTIIGILTHLTDFLDTTLQDG